MSRLISFLSVLVFAACQPSQSTPDEKHVEQGQPQVEVMKPVELEVSDCLGLFERIDRNWIKQNCWEYSTSGVGNASDYGFKDGKGGFYVLLFREQKKIAYLGDLKVIYFKKPWLTFSDDEIWFLLRVEHPALKLTDSIYVGLDMEIPKKVYQMKSVENKWVYDSSCETLTIESDSLNRIKTYTIRKKF